jgi:hypothetical protein
VPHEIRHARARRELDGKLVGPAMSRYVAKKSARTII